VSQNDDDLWKSYQAFEESGLRTPPANTTAILRAVVARDINPSKLQVLQKSLMLHLAALIVTLTICPQFGLGPLGGGHGIMHIVMDYGELACAAFCAGFFFSTSLFFMWIFMSRHETRVASIHSFSLAITLAGTSFGFFLAAATISEQVALELVTSLVWLATGIAILALMRFFPRLLPT
jgi:hypothetical protein